MSPLGWDFYGNPEGVGLEVIAEIDGAGSYEFDLVTVWRAFADGKFWAATDSGCSCPVPYEDHVWPTDFTEVRSVADVAGIMAAKGWDNKPHDRWYYGPTLADQVDFLGAVERALT